MFDAVVVNISDLPEVCALFWKSNLITTLVV